MKTSEQIDKISASMVKAQMKMGNALKDSTNPFFKSKYADLNAVREACLPALNDNQIMVIQPIIQENGVDFVETILMHETGQFYSCTTKILTIKQNDPQAYGSAITYARRYGLQSMVCIGAEDDDGNRAAEKPVEKTSYEKRNPVKPVDAATLTPEQAEQLFNLAKSKGFTKDDVVATIKNLTGKDKLSEVPTVALPVIEGYFKNNNPERR
jgi:hypothetical protein